MDSELDLWREYMSDKLRSGMDVVLLAEFRVNKSTVYIKYIVCKQKHT